MELQLLWAGVRFSAQNGNGEGLLSEAARTGLHLSEVTPQPGGFARGGCPAALLSGRSRAVPLRPASFVRIR